MKLTLDSLKSAGAFTGRPVEKEIEWLQNGETYKATVFVRPLGYHAAVSDLFAIRGQHGAVAGRIAASICDEHGEAVFAVDDILHGPIDPAELGKDPETTKRLGPLDPQLTTALLVVINLVNREGKTKSSLNSTSSGTNSRSPSAAR